MIKNKIRGSGKIVYLRDPQIEGWAKSRQNLRTQYTQTPVNDRDRRQALQKKRNHLMMLIKKRLRQMQQTRLNNIATYMEEHAKSRVMYECANLMMPKPSTRFMIVDTTGQRQTRPEMNIKPVTEHYKKQSITRNSST